MENRKEVNNRPTIEPRRRIKAIHVEGEPDLGGAYSFSSFCDSRLRAETEVIQALIGVFTIKEHFKRSADFLNTMIFGVLI